MKCPLRVIAIPSKEAEGIPVVYECIKEECAWWIDGEEGCLLVFIEKDLAGIWTLLTTIANKMPSPEFFKK